MLVLEQPSLPGLSLPQPDVLRQFARGDLDAFETLFRQHQAEVYRWIMAIVGDPSLAEDLTVETFWRIHRAHATRSQFAENFVMQEGLADEGILIHRDG